MFIDIAPSTSPAWNTRGKWEGKSRNIRTCPAEVCATILVGILGRKASVHQSGCLRHLPQNERDQIQDMIVVSLNAELPSTVCKASRTCPGSTSLDPAIYLSCALATPSMGPVPLTPRMPCLAPGRHFPPLLAGTLPNVELSS